MATFEALRSAIQAKAEVVESYLRDPGQIARRRLGDPGVNGGRVLAWLRGEDWNDPWIETLLRGLVDWVHSLPAGGDLAGTYLDPTIAPGAVAGDELATRWEDFRVPLFSAPTGPGLSEPPLTKFRDNGAGSTGVFARLFRHTADDDLVITVQFPHGWLPGIVKPHFHWSPGANGVAQSGKAIKFRLEYTVSDVGSAYPLTVLIDFVDSVSGINYQHEITSDSTPTIDLSAYSASVELICRITRDNSVANNAPVGVFVTDFDFHIQMDGIGSLNSNGSGGR